MQTSLCLLILTFATAKSTDQVAGLFPPEVDYHEWDRSEKGTVVNEEINLPGYLHSVKTVSNSHLRITKKP